MTKVDNEQQQKLQTENSDELRVIEYRPILRPVSPDTHKYDNIRYLIYGLGVISHFKNKSR